MGSGVDRVGHHRIMRTILNVLWFIFGSGFLLGLAYAFAGVLCFIFIVTIPFGVAAFRLARYAFWPFGYTITDKPSAGVASMLANIVWLIIAGWWLALVHVAAGVALCLTLIGIPFGIANFKLVPAALWPLGREITPTA